MAEDNTNQDQASKQSKGLPIKMILMLLGFLVAEAATVVVVFMIAGGPAPVKAEETLVDDSAAMEMQIEELVVDDKFDNALKGETILYDTEIYVVIRQKHQQRVVDDIEAKQARLSTDIAKIIRRAQPSHFAEPTHATLARQMKSAIDKRLGRDEINDEPIVMEVLIKKMIPFKADN